MWDFVILPIWPLTTVKLAFHFDLLLVWCLLKAFPGGPEIQGTRAVLLGVLLRSTLSHLASRCCFLSSQFCRKSFTGCNSAPLFGLAGSAAGRCWLVICSAWEAVGGDAGVLVLKPALHKFSFSWWREMLRYFMRSKQWTLNVSKVGGQFLETWMQLSKPKDTLAFLEMSHT